MRYFFLSLLLSLNGIVCWGQSDFRWTQDLDLPYTDPMGNELTGTEIIHLVPHKGKLYAGNSYWAENSDPRQGQVWVKESNNGAWKLDLQMPWKHSRVPSLYSFTFERDYLGNAISPDTLLFAGATVDYVNGSGPVAVFVRDDLTESWIQHTFPQISNHPFGYAQIRSMGFHRDRLTGIDMVLAGGGQTPIGVYPGAYNPHVMGKIAWDTLPEFVPSGYQRIMGFAVCNDTLYMATQREIYKRIDGPNPAQRWVQILNLAQPTLISTYAPELYDIWANEEDIRAFRSINNPNGAGEVLMFGALNHIFRIDPSKNYQLLAEQNLESIAESATSHDFNYIQTQLINDYIHPETGEKVQLIGFEGFYDTLYLQQNALPNIGGFNQQGYYFERKELNGEITYNLGEIADYTLPNQPDSLARVRTIIPSPFPEDSGRYVYAGGFAPWFLKDSGGVSKTAWIYKGEWVDQGNTAPNEFRDISYFSNNPSSDFTLDIYTPGGSNTPKPVMVYVHGGSWRFGDKANTGLKDEFFTDLGYVFVSVNYRLSPDPVNLNDNNRIKFPDHPKDVAKAVAWIINNIEAYGGDSSQVSIIGHSAGAHLISLIATDESYLQAEGIKLSQVKCACSLDAGAHDIPYYLNNYVRMGSGQWNTYANAFGTDTNEWKLASPITHLAPGKGIPPFMLVHQGTNQRIDLAKNFAQALQSNAIPTTLLNAFPLDHSAINKSIGATDAPLIPYNDSIAHFFADCLQQVATSSPEKLYPEVQVKLYPNPTKGNFFVQISEQGKKKRTEVAIFSVMGEEMDKFSFDTSTFTYDMSAFPSGMYILRIKSNKRFTNKRILKQ